MRTCQPILFSFWVIFCGLLSLSVRLVSGQPPLAGAWPSSGQRSTRLVFLHFPFIFSIFISGVCCATKLAVTTYFWQPPTDTHYPIDFNSIGSATLMVSGTLCGPLPHFVLDHLSVVLFCSFRCECIFGEVGGRRSTTPPSGD